MSCIGYPITKVEIIYKSSKADAKQPKVVYLPINKLPIPKSKLINKYHVWLKSPFSVQVTLVQSSVNSSEEMRD